jgi:ubiquinone/menaquinone biosynthesis C-methylase UbiE
LYAREYFLAVQGLAMVRSCLTAPSTIRPRVDDIRSILDTFEDFPNSLAIPMREHEVEVGYTEWAPRYDSPNPAIQSEEPIVHAIFAELPVGVALDAACGTGRHAAHLAALGHDVIGVDTTEAMLAVARVKVPSADMRRGRLEDLPLDDASVDLVVCALALTHVPDLEPVVRELGRVVRPGGRVVLSDIHPFMAMTGGIAGFPGEDLTKGIPFVRNLTHQVSEYVGAFNAAGLVVRDCVEPLVGESRLDTFPSNAFFPDATRQAFLGVPYLLIWQLDRPDP